MNKMKNWSQLIPYKKKPIKKSKSKTRLLEQSNAELKSFAFIASHDFKRTTTEHRFVCQFIAEEV